MKKWLSKFFKHPTVVAPTTIFAFFDGPIRYEQIGGEQKWISVIGVRVNWLFYEKPTIDGYAITHQQRRSRFGIMLQFPLCFHVWFMFKKPKETEWGYFVPGSEFGKYIRLGLWRWDPGGSMRDGVLRHWMGPPTLYINPLSTNWD